MTDLRKNFGYTAILMGVNYLFPLFVYPHVSRVLGVDGIGLVSFIDSLTTYFILMSMMGISILGVRETSRVSGNEHRSREVLWSLLKLQASVTIFVLFLMITATIFVAELRANWQLMTIGMSKLVLNLFIVEWYYKGEGRFRYLALRALLIKGIYVVAVWLFVRSESDIILYYMLTMAVVGAYAVSDFAHLPQGLRRYYSGVGIKRYFAPYMSLGVYTLFASVYTTLNMVWLGFACDESEVGYYATSSKVVMLTVGVFAALTDVMLPVVSRARNQGISAMYEGCVKKCSLLIFVISIGVVAIAEIWTEEIVRLLAGEGFEGAVMPLRIMIPFVIGAGQLQVFSTLVMAPEGYEREIMMSTGIAAISGVVLNALLVSSLGAVGSAWVWGVCQLIVLLGEIGLYIWRSGSNNKLIPASLERWGD